MSGFYKKHGSKVKKGAIKYSALEKELSKIE